MTIEERLNKFIEDNRADIIRDITDFVAIKSIGKKGNAEHPYGEECAAMLDCAQKRAEDMGLSVRNNGYQYLVCSLNDKEDYVAMISHLDVVPEGNGWTGDPFKVRERNGYLIGRGVSDDKGPAVAAMYAMKFLKEYDYQANRNIKLVLGSNEETGMRDMEIFSETEKLPLFGFSPDSSFPVCRCEKGLMGANIVFEDADFKNISISGGVAENVVPDEAVAVIKGVKISDAIKVGIDDDIVLSETKDGITVKAKGVSAHSAFADNAVNAIKVLCDFLVKARLVGGNTAQCLKSISSILSDYNGSGLDIALCDEDSGKLTVIGGMIAAHDHKCVLNINVRYPATFKGEEISSRIINKCASIGARVESLHDMPPLYFAEDHPVVSALCKICNDVYKTSLKAYSTGGASYCRKIPNTFFFGPHLPADSENAPEGCGGAHNADECVKIETLLLAIKTYVYALIELDSMKL